MDDLDLDAMLDMASKLGVADDNDIPSEDESIELYEELGELRPPPIVTPDGVALDASLDGEPPEVNADGVSVHASFDGGSRTMLRSRRFVEEVFYVDDDDDGDADLDDDDEDDQSLDEEDDEDTQAPLRETRAPLVWPMPVPASRRPLATSQKLERLPGESPVLHHLRERCIEPKWDLREAYLDFWAWATSTEKMDFTGWLMALMASNVPIERERGNAWIVWPVSR